MCSLIPSSRKAFTLVELLVVIGIIALLISIILPAMGKAKEASIRLKCLTMLRNLANAQAMYASEQHNALVVAGSLSETLDPQGTWLDHLQRYSSSPLARRCPADQSKYFDEPFPGYTPAKYRTTSYALNNYVSPTHTPFGASVYTKITQIKGTSSIIQFGELAETGSYASSDHLHVDEFYSIASPGTTLTRIGKVMPLKRHERRGGWQGLLNYAFLDGHAESLRLAEAYTDPNKNKFDPSLLKKPQ